MESKYEVEEENTFQICELDSKSSRHEAAPIRGLGLDLSRARHEDPEEILERDHNIQESEILVVFDLPDGSLGECKFKLGQTVEYLKSFVECEYGIPMTDQDMFLEDRVMMNPLSLLDFSEAKGQDEIYVRVDGPMPAESKK